MKRSILIGSLLVVLACKETPAEKKETWLGTPEPTATAGTAADTTAAATGTHPGSPGGTALVPDVEAGTTVLVMLNENSIAVREQAIPPGPAVLTVQNSGKEVHNLFIEGPDINRAAGDTIAEGASATVEVNFKPGTYTLYCPVANHRQNGEQATVTIAAP